jgi:hypothetical protein
MSKRWEVQAMKKRTAFTLGLFSAASLLVIGKFKKKKAPKPGEPFKPRDFLNRDRYLWKRSEKPMGDRKPPGGPPAPPQARLDEL